MAAVKAMCFGFPEKADSLDAPSRLQGKVPVFVPIYDDNPLRSIRWPYVTVGLIALNVLFYLLEITEQGQAKAASFAIIPTELFQVRVFGGAARGPYDAVPFPEGLTLITYMFLHGDPLHLAGNMLFLWVFGDNVEDAMGHFRFIVFYLACGIFGGLMHAVNAEYGFAHLLFKAAAIKESAGKVPLIGASGAVAGVIAAYVLLYPRVMVWVLAFRIIPLHINAAFALGAWILSQFVMALIPDKGPVAWWAHIGGIIAGAVLIVFMRRPDVPLFGRPPEPSPDRGPTV